MIMIVIIKHVNRSYDYILFLISLQQGDSGSDQPSPALLMFPRNVAVNIYENICVEEPKQPLQK